MIIKFLEYWKQNVIKLAIGMSIAIATLCLFYLGVVFGFFDFVGDIANGNYNETIQHIFLLFLSFAGIAFVFYLYFIPYFVAKKRLKKNVEAIFVLNFFLGWTFLGWVLALTWAYVKDEG